jgi:hypothetical protein
VFTPSSDRDEPEGHFLEAAEALWVRGSLDQLTADRLLGLCQVRMVESHVMQQLRRWFAWISGEGPPPGIRSTSLAAVVLAGTALVLAGAVLLSARSPSVRQSHSTPGAPTASSIPIPSGASSTGPSIPRATTTTLGSLNVASTTSTTQAGHLSKTPQLARRSKPQTAKPKVRQPKRDRSRPGG